MRVSSLLERDEDDPNCLQWPPFLASSFSLPLSAFSLVAFPSNGAPILQCVAPFLAVRVPRCRYFDWSCRLGPFEAGFSPFPSISCDAAAPELEELVCALVSCCPLFPAAGSSEMCALVWFYFCTPTRNGGQELRPEIGLLQTGATPASDAVAVSRDTGERHWKVHDTININRSHVLVRVF